MLEQAVPRMVRYLEPTGLGYDKPLCASLDGFTLHAATRAGGFDTAGREACFVRPERGHRHAAVHGSGVHLRPDSVDARTDIYALGAVAYDLLVGVEVINGKSMVEVCSQHLRQEPAPPSARGVAVPAELRRQIEGCTVEPWDSERARGWWSEHQPDLDTDASGSTGEPRTLTVDGAHRSPTEVAS